LYGRSGLNTGDRNWIWIDVSDHFRYPRFQVDGDAADIVVTGVAGGYTIDALIIRAELEADAACLLFEIHTVDGPIDVGDARRNRVGKSY
jgi:hypothetical protein